MRVAARPGLPLVALSVAVALALTGCSSGSGSAGGSGRGSGSPKPAAPSPEPSSTVHVPKGVRLTDQGSRLSFGDSATVIFESTQSRGTVLRLTVRSVQRAARRDFKGFILDDPYKRQASYYYARVSVKNVGEGDVGGVAVPLWGVNGDNVLLPPVDFTTPFLPCPTRQLPARFAPGASLRTCLVFLSPSHGSLEAVSYRPSQAFNPITWTGTVTKPVRPSPSPKPSRHKSHHKSHHKPHRKGH